LYNQFEKFEGDSYNPLSSYQIERFYGFTLYNHDVFVTDDDEVEIATMYVRLATTQMRHKKIRTQLESIVAPMIGFLGIIKIIETKLFSKFMKFLQIYEVTSKIYGDDHADHISNENQESYEGGQKC